jgi:hypothetical protein
MTFPSKLPPGFVVPAQPVQRDAPPAGADIQRDGDNVRLCSRKAIDWTDRLPAIAKSAVLLKARSFSVVRSTGLGSA